MRVISSLSALLYVGFYILSKFYLFLLNYMVVLKAEEENVNKTEQIVVKAHLSCYIVIKINS